MTATPDDWTVKRKLVFGGGVVLCCCVVLAVMTYRDLSKINFGNVDVHKEGIGPSSEQTVAGGTN